MTRRPRVHWPLALLLAACATATALLLGGPAPSAAQAQSTIWVCNPDQSSNVCTSSLETTVEHPDGTDEVITPRQTGGKSRVDCFYVYPTVSDQPTLNSDRSIDAEVKGVTQYQANYLSRRCNVYAPVYRQVTAPALLTRSNEELSEGLRIAYPDVRDAFLDYWRNVNQGKRGFVLVGHSQGSIMIGELIRQEIDERPLRRKRMLSAIIPGVLPTVPKGERVGGLYENVPTCVRRREINCVMGWATYDETPPDDTRYGVPAQRTKEAFGWPSGPEMEVICTNPAHLKKNSGVLKTLVRSDSFPGLVGAAVLGYYNLQPPQADTPWIRLDRDRYRAECTHENGAHILKVSPIGDARDYRASPDATWGLHLGDINLAYGNILKIIRGQKRKARALTRG